jgi:hypothetical protein
MSYFAPYIDGTGLHMPTYEDRLSDLVSAYRSIFGIDAEMSESVPDYQLLSVFAKALDDTSALVLQAYNSRNPLYASGNALDLLLPMYGLSRQTGEDDAAARGRISAALAAKGAGSIDAVSAAVKAAKWVRDAKVYENDTDATDARGIPAHSLAAVIYAGDGPSVAKAIWDTKAPGIGTYGNTSDVFTDGDGNEHRIYFTRAITRRVYAYMTIRRLAGCNESAVSAAVTAAVNEYINNGLGVAEPLIIPRLYAVAYNADPELAKTFAVADIFANIQGESTYTREEISCPWNGKVSILASGGLTITFRD